MLAEVPFKMSDLLNPIIVRVSQMSLMKSVARGVTHWDKSYSKMIKSKINQKGIRLAFVQHVRHQKFAKEEQGAYFMKKDS